MHDWKLKLAAPIVYFLGTILLFYFVAKSSGFVLNAYQWVGIFLALTSFIAWFVSRLQLASSFSIDPRSSPLVTSGIYSKIRHPVYAFSFLALVGISIFLEEQLLSIPLVAFLFLQLFRIQKEEKLLEESFGDEYRRYKKTSWF